MAVERHSVNKRLTINQQMADSWQTVGLQFQFQVLKIFLSTLTSKSTTQYLVVNIRFSGSKEWLLCWCIRSRDITGESISQYLSFFRLRIWLWSVRHNWPGIGARGWALTWAKTSIWLKFAHTWLADWLPSQNVGLHSFCNYWKAWIWKISTWLLLKPNKGNKPCIRSFCFCF